MSVGQESQADFFNERGYLGPVRVFSPSECRALLRAVRSEAAVSPHDWSKGHAATSRLYYDLASRPAIVDRISDLIGPDVLLWGVTLLHREPGQVHPWHTDIESADPAGGMVSVWIGLEHTTVHSSLHVIPYSHRFGRTIQEVAMEHDRPRNAVGESDVATWARAIDPRSEVVVLDMRDGEALFFDGRLWHGSNNLNRLDARTAVLLQYATPDRPVRIPDMARLDWPFRFEDAPKPRCIMVRGRDTSGVNRIVPPPPSAEGRTRPRLTTWTRQLALPLAGDPARGWKPHPVFRGSTPRLRDLSCHVSVLDPGHSPHPPHAHAEEEILVMLDGQADAVLPDENEAEHLERLTPGRLGYYPSGLRHTIRNASAGPATYLMFKWKGYGSRGETDAMLKLRFLDVFAPGGSSAGVDGMVAAPLVEGETAHLQKLEIHRSTLAPGAGYAPHTDAYDVAVVVLDGQIETLGQTLGRHAIVFYGAGEAHGMRNVGETPATYLVVEFHGRPGRFPPSRPALWRHWLASQPAVQRWRGRIRFVIGRAKARLK